MSANLIFLKAGRTLAFYTVAALAIIFLEKFIPSGPCTPGAGVLALLLLIPVSLVLCVIAAFRAVEKERSYWVTAMLHLFVLLLIYIYIY